MNIITEVASILPGLVVASVFAVLVSNGILYILLSRRDRKLMEVIRSGSLVYQKISEG